MKQNGAAMTRGSADYGTVPFVTQGRLVRIGGQNILFSPSQQAIFAVNDTAADIWRSLDEGMPPEAISTEIARAGVDSCEAKKHVEAALGDWQRLSLIRPRAPLPSSSAQAPVNQVVAVAGLTVRIIYPAACAFPASTAFRHLEIQRETADVLLQVVELEGRIHLFRDCGWVLSCSPDELPVMLKGQLLTEVLDRGTYELALHAAALVKNERIVLLCGNPGASKSLFVMELLWRWSLATHRVSSMNLEKANPFHGRRVLAQMGGEEGLTRNNWCMDNAPRVEQLIAMCSDALQRLWSEQVYQTPNGIPQNRSFLLQWLRAMIARGGRVLVIDPITLMAAESSQRYREEESFFNELSALAAKHPISIILVSHPKTGIRPMLSNISGSASFTRFADTVLWLESHEQTTDVLKDTGSILPGEALPYNRTLHLLKTKLGPGEGMRIAFLFLQKSLTHVEQGLVPAEE